MNTFEEYVQPERVPVKGPLCCKEHGRKGEFVFDYTTNTYRHRITYPNGAKGFCKSPVEIKRW